MSETRPQDFWLAQLGDAPRFNAWVYSQIRPYLGKRVAEIGCGTANFSVLMAADGRSVTGIEIHQPYADIASARLSAFQDCRVRCKDARSADLAAEQFDSIVMLDVLEHIEDDVGMLRDLGRSLGPGGHLVLKVPAGQWLYSPMDAAIGHFRRYTKRSLREVLGAAGFAPITIQNFNAAAVPGWWLNGVLLKRTTPPAEQVKLFEKMVPALRMAERFLPPPLGISLISAARRVAKPN